MAVSASPARAGDDANDSSDSSTQIEIAPAGEWDIPGGKSAFGVSAAIEFEIVKEFLEIELGVSPMFAGRQTQWGGELEFKTPLASFDNAEISVGIGPQWQHQSGQGESAGSFGATASLDFEFWKLPERRFGWFIEPSYGYSFGKDHERSFGLAAGLLIAVP